MDMSTSRLNLNCAARVTIANPPVNGPLIYAGRAKTFTLLHSKWTWEHNSDERLTTQVLWQLYAAMRLVLTWT